MKLDFKIVCVDDDKEVLEAQSEMIEDFGYSVESFLDPFKAKEYILKRKSEILMIFSDMKMENLSGLEFKEIINPGASEIPFVILTGYWDKDISFKALDLGIRAFLEKPISLDTIKDTVEKYAQKRAEQLTDDREMIHGFLEESVSMLEEIEALILELEEDASENTLNTYFRLLHTIKGTASCVGLSNLSNYTHKYEDFINELRNKTLEVSTETINVLLLGLDDLKVYYKNIEENFHDNEVLDVKRSDIFNIEKFLKSTEKNTSNSLQLSPESHSSEKNDNKKNLSKNSDKKDDDKMTVPMSLLDDFMEESGELTVIRNTIMKTVKKIEARYRSDKDVELLNELLTGMHTVTSNIQGKIVELRKVTLKNTFRPFKRLVRDISKKLGKDVELTVKGEDISVDNIVAKLYSNTLIHILRNSLDHGLEDTVTRNTIGKPEKGSLEISVIESGEEIILDVKDDGKGIDPDIIREKALEKSLYTEEELAQMSDFEVINIIFDSGFSTAQKVSDLSGRGVGMDMVRSSFQNMGGEVTVESQVGIGSSFKLKVPIPKSVLIINTLSVGLGDDFFIFHMDEVAEVIRYEQESESTKLFKIDESLMISHNDESIQLIYLSDLLDKKRNVNEVLSIVILRVGTSKFGLIVDQIFEFEEVVSRKVHESINRNDIYHGAALLGTGQVSMILSAEGIANYKNINLNKSLPRQKKNTVSENYKEYMLFKFESSRYLSVELDYVDRLESVDSKSFQSVGSHTIIKYRDKVLKIIDPGYMLGLKSDNLAISNGKDLKAEIIVVTYNEKSLGLIVNELGEIKRCENSINVDTIDTKGLKGSIYIDNKTICVLDLETLIYPELDSKPELTSTAGLEFSLKHAS